MPLPTFDSTKHDIGIDGVGYMRAPETIVERLDARPHMTRAAEGEGRFDTVQTDSFFAQSDWEGGSGQGRNLAGDRFLCGIGDGSHQGAYFPARLTRDVGSGNGNSDFWFFVRDSTLYGMTTSTIYQIGTTTTQAKANTQAPTCRPFETGAVQNLWTENNQVRKWTGTGADTDVTPTGVSAKVVVPFGRFNWLFGRRTLASAISVTQSKSVSTSLFGGGSVQAGWNQATLGGNLLLAIVHASKTGSQTLVNFEVGNSGGVPWTLGVEEVYEDSTDNASGHVAVYYIESAPSQSGAVTVSFSESCVGTLTLMEVAGMRSIGAIDATGTTSDTGASGSPTTGSTGTLSQAKELVVEAFAVHDTGTIDSNATSSGYTEVDETNFSSVLLTNDVKHYTAYKVVAATTAVTGAISIGTCEGHCGVVITFKGNALTADITQTSIHYTNNDGASWEEAVQGDTTGLPTPIAAMGADKSLWITTTKGLYEMKIIEQSFEDQIHAVQVLLDGPVDRVDVPTDAGAVGNWLAAWEGAIYYNVGATIRRYLPGGFGKEIFPTSGWATRAGKIQALVAGEGGIYFSHSGGLWKYNGRGFWQIATEPSAGAFDYLFWHQGKLYFKGSPAGYIDFGYPGTRPDIVSLLPTNFTTGYAITSPIDFQKVTPWKKFRNFEVHGYFTAGDTAAETGSIELAYLGGCGGEADPGLLGGGATTLSWTTALTLSGDDNAGVKQAEIAVPLTCKRLFLRAKITPGTLGYPVLQAMVVDGRAILPGSKRFVLQTQMTTMTKDKHGARLYPTAADVDAAKDKLHALRDDEDGHFTVSYVEYSGSTTDYVCTAEQFNDNVIHEKRQGTSNVPQALGVRGTFVALELP